MTEQEIESELSELDEQISLLKNRQSELRHIVDRMRSVASIARHKITRDLVEMSSGDDKPWFGEVRHFGSWIKNNGPKKPFAEWNGFIFVAHDVINGHIYGTHVGRVSELPE